MIVIPFNLEATEVTLFFYTAFQRPPYVTSKGRSHNTNVILLLAGYPSGFFLDASTISPRSHQAFLFAYCKYVEPHVFLDHGLAYPHLRSLLHSYIKLVNLIDRPIAVLYSAPLMIILLSHNFIGSN